MMISNRCGSMNIISLSHAVVLYYWSLSSALIFTGLFKNSFLKNCNSRLLTSTALRGGF